MTSACENYCEINPKFFKPPIVNLVKSLRPFKRLSIDFKGPLLLKTKNHYIFTVVNEFSRFPFVFACKDTTSRTVMLCLKSLFSLFGKVFCIEID